MCHEPSICVTHLPPTHTSHVTHLLMCHRSSYATHQSLTCHPPLMCHHPPLMCHPPVPHLIMCHHPTSHVPPTSPSPATCSLSCTTIHLLCATHQSLTCHTPGHLSYATRSPLMCQHPPLMCHAPAPYLSPTQPPLMYHHPSCATHQSLTCHPPGHLSCASTPRVPPTSPSSPPPPPPLAQAKALCINPLYLMIPATISASYAFMLPVATPPNAIAFSYGYLKVKDMVSHGQSRCLDPSLTCIYQPRCLNPRLKGTRSRFEHAHEIHYVTPQASSLVALMSELNAVFVSKHNGTSSCFPAANQPTARSRTKVQNDTACLQISQLVRTGRLTRLSSQAYDHKVLQGRQDSHYHA